MPVQMNTAKRGPDGRITGSHQPTPMPLSFTNTLILNEPRLSNTDLIGVRSSIATSQQPTDTFQIFEQVINLQKSQSFNRRCDKGKLTIFQIQNQIDSRSHHIPTYFCK